MIRHLLLLTLLALLALFPGASANARAMDSTGRLVSLSIIDRYNHSPLPMYGDRNQHFVEGYPGQRYAVRLSNRTGGRVLVVLSIDGINAVSGETANPQQSGYVLEPYQSTDITGWRKSLSEVAAFEFASLPDSYAARTGRPDNVGVIGIAVFQERQPPAAVISQPAHERPAYEKSRSKNEARSAADASGKPIAYPAAPPAPALGTRHGQREYSHANRTHFERATRHPADTASVRYDRLENLIAFGVIPQPRQRHYHRPNPFPGGFVPDP